MVGLCLSGNGGGVALKKVLKGLAAGAAGTAAMTGHQEIRARLARRHAELADETGYHLTYGTTVAFTYALVADGTV